MNIALVHRRFTEHGGTERFLVGWARYLHARGHEVHVYCNESREDLQQETLWTLHHLPMLRWGLPMKVLSLYLSSKRARQGGHDCVMGFGRTQGHDVYRCGGGSHASYLEACRPWWRWDPAAWLERGADRAAVREAAWIISPSEMAAMDLVRDYAVDRARIEVVNNGVDSERFCPDPDARRSLRERLGLSLDSPVLAFLGTGFRRKGLDRAIEVAERLDWPLIAIGHDAQLKRWQRRHPRVHFTGGLQEPQSALVAADVMLLPTRYEPYGNACLEAMSCGVVPVTSRRNGVAEVFPVEGLVGESAEELCRSVQLAWEGGEELKRACRERATSLTREGAYDRIHELLLERQ